eukprot:TRINITY_DN3902_c2_g1_i1.p2 TRINITY_DN3902_c2_g1~~TRINITY_DN3902_c2_g1_i1.p2  ORF type:complete len:263 (+),score=52.71 TRINITY_DN3902_c2_g1_i1:65-853(+)
MSFTKALAILCLVAVSQAQDWDGYLLAVGDTPENMTAPNDNMTAPGDMTPSDNMTAPNAAPTAMVPEVTPEDAPMATPENGTVFTPMVTPEDSNNSAPVMAPEDSSTRSVCLSIASGSDEQTEILALKNSLVTAFNVDMTVVKSTNTSALSCASGGVLIDITMPKSKEAIFDACLKGTTCSVAAFPSGLSVPTDVVPDDSSDGFPVWAIIVIVLGGLLVIGGIAFMVIRSRQTPSFGMTFPEQCGVLDEMEMDNDYKQQALN